MKLDGNKMVGRGFPTDEGQKLAQELIKKSDLEWDDLTIDMSKCPSSLLISAFFNAFWQEIADERRELLEKSQRITWQFAYSFQKDNVASWAKHFQPCVS